MTARQSITIPLPGSRVRWVVGGLIVGLLVAAVAGPLLGPRPILASDPPATPEHTLSVNGTGRVIISPDIADLRLGVTVQSSTVKAARDANAQAMTAVVASLKRLHIADADIRTTILSLNPVYDRPKDGSTPHVSAYRLANAVAVTIRNLDLVGDAIDGALSAGATSLDGVTFRVADQAAAERQARQAAMDEAKAKAQTLAGAAGVSITGVASISETVAPVPYATYAGRDLMATSAEIATPVEPGTNEVSVTVAVTYLIG